MVDGSAAAVSYVDGVEPVRSYDPALLFAPRDARGDPDSLMWGLWRDLLDCRFAALGDEMPQGSAITPVATDEGDRFFA